MDRFLKISLFLCCVQSLYCSQVPDFNQNPTKKIDIMINSYAQSIETKPQSLQRDEEVKYVIGKTAAILRKHSHDIKIEKDNKTDVLNCINMIQSDIGNYKNQLQSIDNRQVVLPLSPANQILWSSICLIQQKIMALPYMTELEQQEHCHEHNANHVFDLHVYTTPALIHFLQFELSKQMFNFNKKMEDD
ncbi:MAG: hypothetical protein JO129_04570, partial [Candidatus Dependentiae bacterium]|nr:hypothetical protein [Candidatus Dependentiae bacterium]